MNKKLTAVNLTANLVAFLLSMIINFFLTPFIVKNIGQAANGFIGLANSMITYITVVTMAINSMANRFISIQIFKGNMEKANKYFGSVIIANLIVAGFAIAICLPLIVNLEKLISVPSELSLDVKWLFTIILINLIVNLISMIYNVGVFVKDKLYLNSIRSAQSVLLKGLLLVAMFSVFNARLFFVGIATLSSTVFALLWNRYYTRKFTPFLKVKASNFNLKAIYELVSSGIWNSVNKLSSILNNGLSLLICNIFIGPDPMGLMSISKVIPTMVYNVLGNITIVFSPNLTKNYAVSDTNAFIKTLNNSIKVMGTLLNIPVIIFIAFGKEFFNLWVPTTDANSLYILSVFSIAPLILSGPTACIYDVFSITNKLKLHSLVVLGLACFDLLLTFILLNITDYGIYIIVAVPCITSYLKNIVFTFPYAAHCVGKKWYTFYKPAFRSVVCAAITYFVVVFAKNFLNLSSWIGFFVSAFVCSVICLIINVLLVWNVSEWTGFLISLKGRYVGRHYK